MSQQDDEYTAQPQAGDASDSRDQGSTVVNMARAGVGEMVGTFFLIYTGTATAVAATTGESIAGAAPTVSRSHSPSASSWLPWSAPWDRSPERTSTLR